MATIENNPSPIGKKVRLDRDVSSLSRTFLKGSVMTIVGVSSRGWDLVDDDTGHSLIECGLEFEKLGW